MAFKPQYRDNTPNFQEILPYYYNYLYPYKLIYKWLSYGDSVYFLKREMALTTSTSYSYIRHKSFADENELLNYILRKTPSKIDIGAVFNIPPMDMDRVKNYKPLEKELVFDIDLTDFDEIRTCCSHANICNKCWRFITIACEIIDRFLIEDLGYKNILWVYSGRRGVHCWVCDPEVRTLSNAQRKDLLSYIDLVKGGIGVLRRVSLPYSKLHTSIKKSLNIINKYFLTIIKEQNILSTDENLMKFLYLLQDVPQCDSFKDVMLKFNDTESRWNAFTCHLSMLEAKNTFPSKLKYLQEEIILHYTYPRIDGNVTIHVEHLLKSPFSIHPKTGRISVPFNSKEMDKFDINKAPTIDSVLTELNNEYGKLLGLSNVEDNIRKTSLCEALFIFEEFLKGLK